MIPGYHSVYCHWILCDRYKQACIVWLWGPRSVCWWEKQKKSVRGKQRHYHS